MVRRIVLPQIKPEMKCEPRVWPLVYPLLIRNLNFLVIWPLCYNEAFGAASI